jgi:hypothetical protein
MSKEAVMRGRLALGAVLIGASLAVAAPAGATTRPFCGIRWGSTEKVDAHMSGAHLTNVRAGRHACFDRLVVDLDGPAGGYAVRYVPAATHLASGEVIPLRGAAFLEVIVRDPAYDFSGMSTFPRAGSDNVVNVSGFRTLRQVAWGGSFEGLTELAVGVRARLPMRVFVLTGPGGGSRVVVDIAHRW